MVMGAGPAGLSAAIWCRDLGMSVVIIETAAQPGGQLNRIFAPIENYPGVERIGSQTFKDNLLHQVAKTGGRILVNASIAQIDLTKRSLLLQDGEELSANAIIIATGVQRRRLGVQGEEELSGMGILESGVRDRALVDGKVVAVIGGGDAALENALIFSETARSVILIHRSSSFSARSEFLSQVRESRNILLLQNTRVVRFLGEGRLRELEIESSDSTRRISVDAALVRIGVRPNTDFLEGLSRDDQGYIIAGATGETSVPFVYAVGDVALPASPTIAAAVGMGSAAAKHIETLLRQTQVPKLPTA